MKEVFITELRFKAWPDTLYGYAISVNDQRHLFKIIEDLNEFGVKFNYQYVTFFGRVFLSGLFVDRDGLVDAKDRLEARWKSRYLEVINDEDWVLSSTGDPGTIRNILVGSPSGPSVSSPSMRLK